MLENINLPLLQYKLLSLMKFINRLYLSLVKFFSDCPCPRCLINRKNLHEMGYIHDMQFRVENMRDPDLACEMVERSRRAIFARGYSTNSRHVKEILLGSFQPVRNAIIKTVSPGFNFFEIFTPDVLHEIKLGVWKDLLIHLIRILYAYDPYMVEEMNAR